MAEEITGRVEKVTLKGPFKSKFGDGEYYSQIIQIKSINYSNFVQHKEEAVHQGDTVVLKFQSVKSPLGIENRILKNGYEILKNGYEVADAAPWQDNSMEQNIKQAIVFKDIKLEKKEMSLENVKSFKIEGTLWYAHIKELDTKGKFPSNKYKTDLSIDEGTAGSLTALGVLVKDKQDEKGKYVTLKSTFQPTVLDSEGNQLIEIPLMGNGSRVLITTSLYDNKAPQGGKKCLGLQIVQILELVQYDAPLLSDLNLSK